MSHFYFVYCLSIVLEKSDIFQNLDIYDFGWSSIALQFSKCPKGLYKMNDQSIKGFLTN